MNKKYLLILSLIFICFRGIGQTVPDITGSYDRSQHGDPQGGAKLFVLKDHKYLLVFFGGVQIGTWNMDKDHVVEFKPTEPTQRFTLHGRHNKELKGGTRVCFMDFTTAETFMHHGNMDKDKTQMKRVFNTHLSCIKPYYIHRFEGSLPQLSFTYKNYAHTEEDQKKEEIKDTYTFQNSDNYNDFVAFFYREERPKRSFTATAKDGKLYFSEDDAEQKQPLPDHGEDLEMINTIAGLEVSPEEYYFNASYTLYEGNIKKDTKHYTYDVVNNIYINKIKPVKGYESEDSFDVVYPFKAVKTVAVQKIPYTIDQVPLMMAKCAN